VKRKLSKTMICECNGCNAHK